MSLQDKTDFELNVLVAMCEMPELAYADESQVKAHDDGAAEFWLSTPDGYDANAGRYNYTGDWAQIGPIIEREKICQTYRGGENWEAWEFNDRTSVEDANPLRAAAICYLMMKGAE